MGALITLYWHNQSFPISSRQSHEWQRRLLARHLGRHDVAIDRSHGKPVVCPPYTIFFSVSHSAFSGHHAWVMAVYPHCDVGVDMEPLNRSIQPAVFHRGTHGDPPPLYHPRQRVLAWTQFEALAKCRGAGIRFPIPRRFPNRFGSFLWKGWVVTLACSAGMPSLHVVR